MEGHILNTRYGLEDEHLDSLIEDARDYAFHKGCAMKAGDLTKDCRICAPFCLLPSPFPEKWFEVVKNLQTDLNYVLLKVAHSKEFLEEALSSTINADEFIQNIFKIFQAVEKEKQLSLGLIRSDYMLDTDGEGKCCGIKQIENNTIASSFAGLAPTVRDIHEYVLDKLGQKGFEQKLPPNESVFNLAKALISAWDVYDNNCAVILFVVEDITLNISDQRALEYAILDYEKRIQVLRCSFKDLRSSAQLKGKTLFVKDKEVAVVYYRIGYMPDDYELEDWETRLLMERSTAVKCPSAGLQLAGTKKVQQYLNRPGILERFVPEDVASKLRGVFAGQYVLDNESSANAISAALQHPEKYVLKPEREGGGNNFFGDDLKNFLQDIKSSSERSAYILMDRINPPLIPNCLVRRGEIPAPNNVVSELGIYGTILGNDEVVHHNNQAGHLLRSKNASSTECGIVAGFGALDSPYLE